MSRPDATATPAPPSPTACGNCAYELAGLDPEAPCPECGMSPPERDQARAARNAIASRRRLACAFAAPLLTALILIGRHFLQNPLTHINQLLYWTAHTGIHIGAALAIGAIAIAIAKQRGTAVALAASIAASIPYLAVLWSPQGSQTNFRMLDLIAVLFWLRDALLMSLIAAGGVLAAFWIVTRLSRRFR